jgi:hypothetical protein
VLAILQKLLFLTFHEVHSTGYRCHGSPRSDYCYRSLTDRYGSPWSDYSIDRVFAYFGQTVRSPISDLLDQIGVAGCLVPPGDRVFSNVIKVNLITSPSIRQNNNLNNATASYSEVKSFKCCFMQSLVLLQGRNW